MVPSSAIVKSFKNRKGFPSTDVSKVVILPSGEMDSNPVDINVN